MPGKHGHKFMQAYATVCLFIVFPLILKAQPNIRPDLIQSPITGNIPVDNQNWEISQDPVSGFMYFANSKGLVEYNGLSTRLFRMPFTQGLRSVYTGNDGRIFTGSFEDFGYWIRDNEGGLRYTSLTGGITIPKNDEIWNIIESNGVVYFQSFTTIYTFDSNAVKSIKAPGNMLFMFKTNNHFMVQVLGKGLFFFDGEKFDFINGSAIFSTREVLSILTLPQEEYLICTANDGIYRYKNKAFLPWENDVSRYLKHYTCNAGLVVNDSLYAFGTILGGLVFSNNNGDIIQVYNYANGLNNNTVLSLFLDKSGDIWAGLDEGVNHLGLNSPYKPFKDRNGSLGTIYTVYMFKNLLYLGTNHGLFVSDVTRTSIGYDFKDLALIPGTQGQVWKLFEYGDRLFCGHNDGTLLVDGRNAAKVSDVTGGWTFAGYHEFLLQGTYTGLVCFVKDANGNWKFRNRIEGFNEPARYLEIDYLGYIWVVHPHKGIYRLELSENADSVINSQYFDAVDEPQGNLSTAAINNRVVFMNGMNIYSYDSEKNSFFVIESLSEGLGEYKKASRIFHHEKNSYWFILGNKIALFDISKSFEVVKIHELLQKFIDLPGHEQQIIALDRKTLLIPTRRAFTLFDISSIHESEQDDKPVIVRMVFTGKKGSHVLIPGENRKASVSNSMNNLTAYFANAAAYGKSENSVLYRIKELDEVWHHTLLDHVDLFHLKFGTYHLQVKTPTGTFIHEAAFTIKRPWYLSYVAIGCYIVFAIAMALLGMKIFRIELNRHRQLIEYEVRKTKLENELDFKSYELMLTMRYLIRKTEILQELKTQVDAVKEESSKYPVKFIREMERIIREGLDSQTEEWKSAMTNLKLSHEGFFRRLKEKCPNLTPNDLRLCSYLRMNFSTKEIAHLLNISGRAVEIGRYRLRSKLKLDHKVNLTEYLITEAEKA